MRKKISFRQFDKQLFLTPILIFVIGLFSLYSASFKSSQALDQILAMRQVLWMGIGILLVFLIVRFDYFKLQDFVWPLYVLSVIFLILVLFMPARLGAHRWVPLGGFNLQPSEFAKLAIILALASFFTQNRIEYTPKRKWVV